MSADSIPASKRHFIDRDSETPVESHFFEQLDLDLNWATDDIKGFRQRYNFDSLSALEESFKIMAGRRWNRFKEAAKDGNERRASEMKSFANFWYCLAARIAALKHE